tara:strand:+ start:1009 stop:1203 length:195 start_codon:yes stop_codon:yes gene_type:complete
MAKRDSDSRRRILRYMAGALKEEGTTRKQALRRAEGLDRSGLLDSEGGLQELHPHEAMVRPASG